MEDTKAVPLSGCAGIARGDNERELLTQVLDEHLQMGLSAHFGVDKTRVKSKDKQGNPISGVDTRRIQTFGRSLVHLALYAFNRQENPLNVPLLPVAFGGLSDDDDQYSELPAVAVFGDRIMPGEFAYTAEPVANMAEAAQTELQRCLDLSYQILDGLAIKR